jgi:hypothetical protein
MRAECNFIALFFKIIIIIVVVLSACQLISSRNCYTGKSKLMTRSLNGITTRLWVDLIIIIIIVLSVVVITLPA